MNPMKHPSGAPSVETPVFNRADICAAYYQFEIDHGTNGVLAERPSNLRRQSSTYNQLFRMGLWNQDSWVRTTRLTPNACAIYRLLEARYLSAALSATTPHLTRFDIATIVVETPSSRPGHHPYQVTWEGTQAARCSCIGFARHHRCRHCREASTWLFSEAGLWATLERVDKQIAALEPSFDSVMCYQLGALQGIKGEIEKRLGLHREADPADFEPLEEDDFYSPSNRVSNCPCGRRFCGGDGQSYCRKCRCTVSEAWKRRIVPVVVSEWEDANCPFESVVVAEPLHPLAASQLKEYGRRV